MQENIPTDHIDINHHLQRQILVRLRQVGSTTYQQLKPEGIEGNAFNYHLRNLKKTGLIAHENDRYTLTSTGYLVVDAFSLQNQRLMLRPHLYTVLLITAGEYVLVYEHARPPIAGLLTLLSGKLHYGDDFNVSIDREARRRLLSADYKTTVLCPFNVRYMKDGEILLHRSGTLWHLEYRGPLETRHTTNGQSRWLKWDELNTMRRCLPEINEGIKRLTTGSHQPIDISCEI